VFEGPRSAEFPNKPLHRTVVCNLFEAATHKLGLHPFPTPAANASAAYTNPEGLTMGACQYCGHCERFGCEANAKASPNVNLLPVVLPDPNFTLRTHAYVRALGYDKRARKVSSVQYVDLRTGEEYEQPAGIVILAGYVFTNSNAMKRAKFDWTEDRLRAFLRDPQSVVRGNKMTFSGLSEVAQIEDLIAYLRRRRR
jgi:gluconate 2-dehydrogenase alpha chain